RAPAGLHPPPRRLLSLGSFPGVALPGSRSLEPGGVHRLLEREHAGGQLGLFGASRLRRPRRALCLPGGSHPPRHRLARSRAPAPSGTTRRVGRLADPRLRGRALVPGVRVQHPDRRGLLMASGEEGSPSSASSPPGRRQRWTRPALRAAAWLLVFGGATV